MFKHFLLIVLLSSSALAGDFDSNQFNLKVKNKDYGIEFREYTQSNRSHIQIEKYVDKWKFAYRYDEDGDKTEHRPRIDYQLYKNDYVYVTPRVEYRYYEGNTDDYFRVRSAFGLTLGDAYLELTPMLRLGEGYKEDLSIDEYQSKLGYKWKVDENVKVDTFVQREADKHFEKTDMFFGATLELEF
jgi:hypothetical protein